MRYRSAFHALLIRTSIAFSVCLCILFSEKLKLKTLIQFIQYEFKKTNFTLQMIKRRKWSTFCFNLYFDVATHSCIFWLTLRVSPLWAKIDSEKATNGYMCLLLVWIKKAYKEFTRFNLFSVIPLLSASVKLSVSFALWQLSVSHAYVYCISSNEHPCSVSAFPRITPHS